MWVVFGVWCLMPTFFARVARKATATSTFFHHVTKRYGSNYSSCLLIIRKHYRGVMPTRLSTRICVSLLVAVVVVSLQSASAFRPGEQPLNRPRPSAVEQRKDTSTTFSRWTNNNYESTQTNSLPGTSQQMLKNLGSDQERRSHWKLSNSVLADCDTLPSFSTAHGLLSPETVSRMDENTHGGSGNRVVAQFLQMYRRNGPMSCLPMLSDPTILPHLTRALRDITL